MSRIGRDLNRIKEISLSITSYLSRDFLRYNGFSKMSFNLSCMEKYYLIMFKAVLFAAKRGHFKF